MRNSTTARRWLALALITIACTPRSPAVQQSAIPHPVAVVPDFTRARARMDSLVAAGFTPSFAAAVAQNGKILWETGIGLADREKGTAATGAPTLTVANGVPVALESPTMSGGGLFTATAATELPAGIVPPVPHRLELNFRLEETSLGGYVTAGARTSRPRFGLPFYAELTKQR